MGFIEELKRRQEKVNRVQSLATEQRIARERDALEQVNRQKEEIKGLRKQASSYLEESAFPKLADTIRKSGVDMWIFRRDFWNEERHHGWPVRGQKTWPKNIDINSVGYTFEWDFKTVNKTGIFGVGTKFREEEFSTVAVECRSNGLLVLHGRNISILDKWQNNFSLQEDALEKAFRDPYKRRLWPYTPFGWITDGYREFK